MFQNVSSNNQCLFTFTNLIDFTSEISMRGYLKNAGNNLKVVQQNSIETASGDKDVCKFYFEL